METKKSIVRSAIYKRPLNSQYGEMHIFEITFDNNDKGDYISRQNPQNSFIVGKETEYTIEKVENGQYTNYKIKAVSTNNGGGFKANPVHEHKRAALNCAVSLACHSVITVDKIPEYAKNFMKFLSE